MDRLTFSGPFIPLQLGLLWYFLPPWVGIHTIWLVVCPEDALPVLFLLLGPWLGERKIFRRFGRTASLCSALLLVVLGVYECFV